MANQLTPKQKELLKEFVRHTCENCHKKSDNLQIHRIHRGISQGQYQLRNILVICKECHRRFHYGEF